MDQYPEYELTPNDVVKMWTPTKIDWVFLVGVTILAILTGGWIGYNITRIPPIKPWPICQVCYEKMPRFGQHIHHTL